MTKEKKTHPEKAIFQVSQKTLLYDVTEKKFLLVKCADTEGTFYKNYGPWSLAGGRIDTGEDIDESLAREIREELGEDVKYTIEYSLLPIWRGLFQYHTAVVITIGFLTIYKGGEITLSHEHSEFRWATAEEIEKDEEIKPWLKEFVKVATIRLKEKEYLNDLKRLQADFENYKKRMASDREDVKRFITTGIIADLVPILDNFNMAVAHVPEDKKGDPWVTGITYIEKQFEEVIAGYGVNVMEVKVGDAFDPTRHEALEMQNGNIKMENEEEKDQSKEHTVVKVMQKGYTMGDKVIRAAKVTVN